jgi:hypothetical protein
MPLDPYTAALIAARHGLGLADAASLRGLTDDPDEADRLAARFASTDPRMGADAVRRRRTHPDGRPHPTPDQPRPPRRGQRPTGRPWRSRAT